MATTIDPVSPFSGTQPAKTQTDQTVFDANVNSQFTYINALSTELNTTTGQINTVASEIESSATAASDSATDSATSAAESLASRNEAQIAANTAVSSVASLPDGLIDTNDDFSDITNTWNKQRIALETNSAPYKPVVDLDFARDTYKSYVGLAAGWQTAPLLDLATFSRVGDATGVNAFGNVETVGTDQPRVVFENGVAKGIILEGDGSNLGAYSEELDQWTGTATATLSAIESPVESNFWEVSGTNNIQLFQSASVIDAGQSVAMSVFVLKNIGDIRIDWVANTGGTTQEYQNRFDTSSGEFTITSANIDSTFVENLGNSYRIGVIATKNGTGNTVARLDVSTASTTTTSAWFVGGQIEESDTVTSYIKTTTVPVSRNADDFALDLSNVDSNSNWAIFADFTALEDGRYLTFNDGTTANRITLRSLSGNINAIVVADSVDTSISTAAPLILNQANKAMIVRNGGDIYLYMNGALVGSSSIGVFSANTLKLGQGITVSTKTNSLLSRVQVYTAFEYDTTFDALAKSWTGV